MEKKLKVMAARAESAPTNTSSALVAAHWLVRKQKPTNHRKVQRAGETTRREEWAPGTHGIPRRDSRKGPSQGFVLCDL